MANRVEDPSLFFFKLFRNEEKREMKEMKEKREMREMREMKEKIKWVRDTFNTSRAQSSHITFIVTQV